MIKLVFHQDSMEFMRKKVFLEELQIYMYRSSSLEREISSAEDPDCWSFLSSWLTVWLVSDNNRSSTVRCHKTHRTLDHMYMRNELYQPLLTQEAQSIILLSAFAVFSQVFKMWCGVTRSHLYPWPIHCVHCCHSLLIMDLGTSPTHSTGCREGEAADPDLELAGALASLRSVPWVTIAPTAWSWDVPMPVRYSQVGMYLAFPAERDSMRSISSPQVGKPKWPSWHVTISQRPWDGSPFLPCGCLLVPQCVRAYPPSAIVTVPWSFIHKLLQNASASFTLMCLLECIHQLLPSQCCLQICGRGI